MERNSGRNQRSIEETEQARKPLCLRLKADQHDVLRRDLQNALRGERGQSTVEFAVVTACFLSVTAALSLLWHAFGDGMLVEHALAVASHHIQLVFPTTVADIFLY